MQITKNANRFTQIFSPKLFVTLLISAGLILFIGCTEEEQPEPGNQKQISSLKMKGGNGNGNGGNGNGNNGGEQETLYQVQLSGLIISSSFTYGVEVTNNKKYDLMQTDACGKFQITGIAETLVPCTNNILDFCDDGFGLRQFDKRRNPGRVWFTIWILDGVNGNHNFQMYGDLQDGASTLFPSSGSVEIIFDTWSSSGPNICDDAEGEFTNTDPDFPVDASVTITRITDTTCPNGGADTCP